MSDYDIKTPRTVPVVADTEVGPVAVSIEVDWALFDGDEDTPAQWVGVIQTAHAQAEIAAEVILRKRRGGDPVEEDGVPTTRLRGEYERMASAGEINAYTIAARMGWTRKKQGTRVPDTDKVLDVLGVTRERRTIPYETACQLAAVMHIDPVEVGL